MYPTLEIDIEGELVKLKVKEIKQKIFLDRLNSLLCTNILYVVVFRTTWSGSSPW